MKELIVLYLSNNFLIGNVAYGLGIVSERGS